MWLILSLFAVTLSERPYPHYFLQSIPAVSILLAMLFTLSTFEQVLVIIPLTLFAIIPVFFKFWYYPTLTYYTRFMQFATQITSKEQYFQTFGGNVLRNYEISDYLATNTKRGERVFVWGDSPAIYALSRRLPAIKYAADYHIKDFSSKEEVLYGLKSNMPTFVVVLPDAPSHSFLHGFLQKKLRPNS